MMCLPMVGQECYAVVEYWGTCYVMQGMVIRVGLLSVDVQVVDGGITEEFRVAKSELYTDGGQASEACSRANGVERGRWKRRSGK